MIRPGLARKAKILPRKVGKSFSTVSWMTSYILFFPLERGENTLQRAVKLIWHKQLCTYPGGSRPPLTTTLLEEQSSSPQGLQWKKPPRGAALQARAQSCLSTLAPQLQVLGGSQPLKLPWSPVPGTFLGKMKMGFLLYSHGRKWPVVQLRDQDGASSGSLGLEAALQILM